jgi:hypothetical protein
MTLRSNTTGARRLETSRDHPPRAPARLPDRPEGVEAIMTFDDGFERYPGIRRLA